MVKDKIYIGDYQVCEEWPKDRRQRELSYEDISHYEKIVVALGEKIRLMKQIDEVIAAHVGWPINPGEDGGRGRTKHSWSPAVSQGSSSRG